MISVVIPFFNAQTTLKKCISSLICQSYDDFEVIFINDNSYDNSAGLIHQQTQSDSRFKLVTQSTDKKGPSSARNLGMQLASGTYIYFMDADDWIEPETFEVMLTFTLESTADLVCASHIQDFENDSKAKYDGTPNHDHQFSQQELNTYIGQYLSQPYIFVMLVHCWGKLYKRSLINEHSLQFNESLSQLEDVEFNFNYLCHANSVIYKNAFLYHHTQATNQSSLSKLTGTEDNPLQKYLTAYNAIEHYLKVKDKEKQIYADKQLAHLFINTVIITLIRLSKKMFRTPSKALVKKIMDIAKSEEVAKRLHFYHPNPNESKLIFLALKTNIPFLVLISGLIRASVLLISK